MRKVPRIAFAWFLCCLLLIPLVAASQELPTKVQKYIPKGTTQVDYAGESFLFVTTVPLQVTFAPAGENKIRLTFRTVAPARGVGGPKISLYENYVQVHWIEWNTDVFSGEPPEGAWSGILDTESGYTEK
jgi:hypothetical protein